MSIPGHRNLLAGKEFKSSLTLGRMIWFSSLVLTASLSFVGCQGVQPAAVSGAARVMGTVSGGRQAVAGASIQLYVPGSGGDGSAATPLIKSLVTTSSSGSFDFTGMFACPSAGAQVYIVATVGNQAAVRSSSNPQVALMAALGPCGNLAAVTDIAINEVTTVAAIYELAPFMQSYSAIGSASFDAPAMASAFLSAANLAKVAAGSVQGFTSPSGQAIPSERLNTLAVILSACIDSISGSSGDTSACGLLTSLASSTGYATPSDTVGALLNIARNPSINVAAYNSALGGRAAVLQAPTFSTPAGTYQSVQTVALSSAAPGATIYYTTNGSNPTSASTLYTSPIKVSSTSALAAVAILPDSTASQITTASYVINLPVTTPLLAVSARATGAATADAQAGTQTTTVAISNSVQTAGIDRLGINIGGLGGYGSQQLFKSLNYVNGGYFPGSYAGTTYSCGTGGPNTTTSWSNDVTHPSGYPANYWAGATFTAINAATGTSYGSGTVTASTSNTGATGVTFTLSPAISAPCSPSQNDVLIVRLTKQNTLISPNQLLNGHICNEATWNTSDTSPSSGNTQQSLSMPSGCGLTFYIDATVTNRTNTNPALASQQTNYINLNGSYNATFKAKCLVSGCSVNFNLGRLGGTTFIGSTTVNPSASGTPGAGWTTFNYPFSASETGSQSQTIGYSFSCNGSCLLQDADVIEGSTLPGNTTVFRDAVVYELQKLHPGSIRYMDGSQWCSDVADEIATTGNRRWCGASNYFPGVGQGIGYNDVLALGNFIGSDVLISVGALNQPSDWAMLINWLNSSGWTTTYANAGHKIYLEDGNEAWNSGVGATLYFGNGTAYGYTLGPNMAAAKAASGYNSNVIKLVGNSWVAGNQGYGPFGWIQNTLTTAQHTPNGLPDFVDLAPYMLNYLGNFDTSGSNVAATGAPFLDEWAENANIDSVTSPVPHTESMYLNQQYAKSTFGVNTLVYEVNFSTLSGAPATQLQLDQIGASVGNALATAQHTLLMQRDSQVTGPIHVFTLAEPYTGYSCNGCSGQAVMPLWGINHLMGTGPGQTPGATTGDRPLAIATQIINNAIGANSNLMSITQTGTPTFNYSGGQLQGSSNTISPNSAVPYVNCFSYSNGATAWTTICFNNNLTTAEAVTLTGAGAPTGSVSQTVFPGPSNLITDHNENTYLGSSSIAPVVTLPSATTASGTSYTIPPASMIVLTYNTAGGSTPALPAPTFSPAGGTYTGAQSVTISDATAGTTIYYTTNGTTPTTVSSVYSGPISVSSTQTLQAIAVENGFTNSPVATAAYTINTPVLPAPTFSPAGGTYTSAQSVAISDTTAGTTIYYTVDGTTPNTATSVYSSPITVSASQTVQAIAVKNGSTGSPVASAAYTISPALPAPTFSLAGGTYTSAQSVTISDATAGTTIYYTTNGAAPTTSSSVYAGAIPVGASQTLQALAVKSGFTNSPVASAAYTINIVPGGTTYINLGSGQFNASSFYLNGGPSVTNGALQITDGNNGEVRSAWFNTKVPVGNFVTDFTFQQLNARADGMTFVIQGQGPAALGSYGAGLGYQGINNSVAVKFDLFDNSGEGSNSTGLYTGGAVPTIPSIDLTSSGINLHSGDTLKAHIVYDGTNLTLTLTDTVNGASFSKAFPVDLPGAIGGSTAYVGFTGGTGTFTAIQNILNWSYVSPGGAVTIPTAAAPSFSPAGGTYTSAQSVKLSDATAGATIYYTTDGSAPTTSSSVYSSPITVGASQTLQAIAAANGYTASSVATAAYTINIATTVPPGGGTTYINVGTGQFTASSFSFNGGASVTNGALQITDGNNGEIRSGWFNTKVPVGNFVTDFTFQQLNARADGLTFVIQGQGPTALGGYGPGIGYQGITNSVAIKFDLFDNSGEGANSTGLYTGGAVPTIPSTDLTSSGINLHSGNILKAHVVYDGTNLTLTLTDTVTGSSFVKVFPVDIPGAIGASTAYVGFTGGTGTFTSIQNVLTWSYVSPGGAVAIVPTAATPAFAPAGGTYTSAQSVTISDATAGATIYYTTNGSTPTTSSSVYSSPVAVGSSQTLQAIAVANGYTNSSVATAAYIINIATTVPPGGGTTYINLGSGQFNASSFYLNGGASVTNGALQVTDGNNGEVRSAWFNTKVPIGNFVTDFTFQQLNARADGMTFVIQGQGPTALGSYGAGLGYQNINNSVAIKFDLFDNSGEGSNSTGLYTGGAVPTIPFTDLTSSGINLHSGNILEAHAVYDGTNLTLTLSDTVSGASFTKVFPVDIPGAIGGSTAYVGFTGGTGTFTAIQNILTWSYVSPGGAVTTAPTAAAPVFSPAGGTYTSAQSVTLSDATAGATIFYTTDGSAPTTSSSAYSGPIAVGTSQTLQAIAVANGYTNSSVATAAYTINIPSTVTPGGGTSYINIGSGQFAASSFSLNGGATVTNGALQVTDGGFGEVRSAWFNTSVPVGNFVTDFTFQQLNARADGMTFVIQGQGPKAVGYSGGGLSYQGIPNSIAIKFDLFDNSGEGSNSTGLYTGGVSPTIPSIDLTPSGINLHSGDIMKAHLVYDGTNLTMTLTDIVTGAFFVKAFPVNIQGAIGAGTAYVGFTGGTGTFTAIQNILAWSYVSTP